MKNSTLTLPLLTALALCLSLPLGCSDDGTEVGDSMTDTDSGDGDGDPGDGDGDPAGDVPTNSAELLPWLEAESYVGFSAESAAHAATGSSPHGTVRVFINSSLDASLSAGDPAHPVGAAAVKELFDGENNRIGWAVSVKIQADSDGGNGWYWYEIVNDNVVADANGDGTCIGCHASTGVDFFTTVYPLQ